MDIPTVDVPAKGGDAASGLGIRHIQACVMGVSTCLFYSLRTTLSVAIVAMVDYKDIATSQTTLELAPTYQWDEKTQGILLSSFYWGYFLMQLPAGVLTERFGAHRFLCFANLGSSILTLLVPQCAYMGGWMLVCANMMLQGLIQGFAYPAIYTLLGVWAPPSERATLSGMTLGGALLGAVVAAPVSGFLAATYGWPFIFYTFGVVGIVVGLLSVFFGSNTPANHRMISESEKLYIEASLGGAKVKRSVPWKSILTSTPVIASIITLACFDMIFYTFAAVVPTYIATVLKFDVGRNGVLSAIPYLVSWILSFVFSWLCDFFISRGWLGLTAARKVFNSIGHFGSALCLILMSYATSSVMAVFLLTCFLGINAAAFPGGQAIFMDVAPNYSGTIFSIGNFFSAFLGIVGPMGVGFIVTEAGSVDQWRIVLFSCAAILFFSNIVFIIWATAETQPWNWPEETKDNGTVEKAEKIIEITRF